MKTELRLAPHNVAEGLVIELHFDGQFIGSLYGADGPGVRLITKHPFEIHGKGIDPNIMDILIDPSVAHGSPPY